MAASGNPTPAVSTESDSPTAAGAETPSGDVDDPSSSQPPEGPRGCHVELSLLTAGPAPSLTGYVDHHLASIAEMCGIRRGVVTVAVVDDDRMVALHKQFLNRDSTTDVLTFDLRPPDDGGPDGEGAFEGDIVVCMDEAVRQATERGHEVRAELLLYAVHGLLHLVGFDDHDPHEAAIMHAREDELLVAVGVGPVYRPRGNVP